MPVPDGGAWIPRNLTHLPSLLFKSSETPTMRNAPFLCMALTTALLVGCSGAGSPIPAANAGLAPHDQAVLRASELFERNTLIRPWKGKDRSSMLRR